MSVDINHILSEDALDEKELINKEISFLKIQYLKKSDKLNVQLKAKEVLSETCKLLIKKLISKRLGSFDSIQLICLKVEENITLKEVIDKYWDDISDHIGALIPVCKDCLKTSKRYIENENLYISTGNLFIFNLLRNKNIELIISKILKDNYGNTSKIKFSYDAKLIEKDYFQTKDKENTSIIKNTVVTVVEHDKKTKVNTGVKTNYQSKKTDENTILGKNISDIVIDISDVNEPLGSVTIEGDVFKADIIVTKSKSKISVFYITDYTSSITVKFFINDKDNDKVIEKIKPGLHCIVRGNVVSDLYSKEIVLMAKDIVQTPRYEREDTSEEKRVELHLHTQMSAMDGITSASRLIERAAKWGHKAIAITDHGVLQAYPEAMTASKKYNIDIIYGVEAYLVDDGIPIAIIKKDHTFQENYVVFDFETTGLSSEKDKIIEIGAVKISNGEIIETFSKFVNPKRDIPEKIVQLTGINNDIVANEATIDVVLPDFIKFIGDAILVAHNAEFDVSFLKKNLRGISCDFNSDYLDTIPLCKFLYPELKRYKLDIVAKHLGIHPFSHHRAIDDARATGEILLRCFKDLLDKNIESLATMNEEYLKNLDIKKLTSHHLIILVKNQIGLKNLYKLVSKSNLDYFYKKPRLPKSVIEEFREGLIMGSACEAGELYRSILAGMNDVELKEIIDFYDYLEIQPIDNNKFLIRNETVNDRRELENINKRIISLGKLYNKPVVATCDVHFLDPKDEIFRRILMSGQGYSDADEQAPLYLRTTEEMLKEFDYLDYATAKEVVIDNPLKIAAMIDKVKPIPDETFTPKIDGAEDDVRNMTLKKAHLIYGEPLPEVVQKRIDKELNSIINHGYAVLYLIAHKLVKKSLEDGYTVGSRGSVGSSLVATMCSITEVNGLPPHYVCPKCKNSEFILDGSISSGADLKDKDCPKCGSLYIKDGHDIPFETFLGFEGDKEPDIDLNFSGEYQAIVHKYTEVLFGKGYVFKAGTIGTVATKTAYGFVQKYKEEKNLLITKAEIERLTEGCTGIKRTTGQHPGGIMVVPKDNEIFNFTPIQHPADDNDSEIITTHFDYHSISGRLLKLDILGHDDPTIIKVLQDLTGIDPKTVPLVDEKVMSLFTSPDALGVTKEELNCEIGTYGLPEFGTKFVRQMLLDTKPKTFTDLVNISGLSHGTDVWLNNAQYYIKNGNTTLKDCISLRDDIMIYLMHRGLPPKISFTIMEKVRKGKGLNEEDIKIMKENDVPDWYIESCKKIKYMFPKGHAVAYVMMALRIAYFKVYYPKAYYAAYFTVRADDFDAELITTGDATIKRKMEELNALGNNVTQKDKGLLTILEISYEMHKRGIKLLKVDLYKSDPIKFSIVDEGILPPLSSLVGVGENAAKNIALVRKEGPFLSKENLRNRAKVTKTVISTLSIHGCLDGLTETNQLSLF
ncbi:MAG TPA: PolC-type DNA polymerase III [Clostridiaceae bacterium]